MFQIRSSELEGETVHALGKENAGRAGIDGFLDKWICVELAPKASRQAPVLRVVGYGICEICS